MSDYEIGSLKTLGAVANEITSRARHWKIFGRVIASSATVLEVSGLREFAHVGDFVTFESLPDLFGEIVKIGQQSTQVKLLDDRARVCLGARVLLGEAWSIKPCLNWSGRVVDCLGRPLDGRGFIPQGGRTLTLDKLAMPSMLRERASTPVRTGIRAVDAFTPLCRGQRVGIFAGSGVGKSTLLGMFASLGEFDRVVVCLVGERGREVREFIEDNIGAAIYKCLLVVSTSDESAMKQKLSALTAITAAEHFSEQGLSVLFIMDSVTRYANALREVALSSGEPPVARGYPVSVFRDLSRYLERAGPQAKGHGAITAIMTVLVDGDDHNDPVSDAVRGILDGHIVLDRSIANSGRFPAIDILSSVSRLSDRCWSVDEATAVHKLRGLISLYEESKDMRSLGGYERGQDPSLDTALDVVPQVYAKLQQARSDRQPDNSSFDLMEYDTRTKTGASSRQQLT